MCILSSLQIWGGLDVAHYTQFAVKKIEVTCLPLCLPSMSLVSLGTLLPMGFHHLLHVGRRWTNHYLQPRHLCRVLVPYILLAIVHRHPPGTLKRIFENGTHPLNSDLVLHLHMNLLLHQNKKSNEKIAETNIINICWFD